MFWGNEMQDEYSRSPEYLRNRSNVSDDDSEGWKSLLDEPIELALHFGGKAYTVTISREEYQRMVDDGVVI